MRLDHVVLTLPTDRFVALNEFLTRELADAWASVPMQQGALAGQDPSNYVEVWDAGGFATDGDQVAISCSDEPHGRVKAGAFFGHAGMDWSGFGAEGWFTIVPDLSVGHPMGSTFLSPDGRERSFSDAR